MKGSFAVISESPYFRSMKYLLVSEDWTQYVMTEKEIIQIENEVFTKLVIEMLKQQRADGITEFLLDKYTVDKETKERVRKILNDERN